MGHTRAEPHEVGGKVGLASHDGGMEECVAKAVRLVDCSGLVAQARMQQH
jgi:hypothetical protein